MVPTVARRSPRDSARSARRSSPRSMSSARPRRRRTDVAGADLSTRPVTVEPPAKKRRKRGGPEKRPFWLLAPTTILLALIVIVPLVLAVWVSLLDLNQYTLRKWLGAPFIGFANYTEALTGSALGSSALPLGLLAALTVNSPFRGRAIVRSLYLIPYVLPSFVTALLWRLMFLDNGLAHR